MPSTPTTRESTGGSRAESTNELRIVSCLRGTNRIRVDCYGNDIVIRAQGVEKSSKNKVP